MKLMKFAIAAVVFALALSLFLLDPGSRGELLQSVGIELKHNVVTVMSILGMAFGVILVAQTYFEERL